MFFKTLKNSSYKFYNKIKIFLIVEMNHLLENKIQFMNNKASWMGLITLESNQ